MIATVRFLTAEQTKAHRDHHDFDASCPVCRTEKQRILRFIHQTQGARRA